MKFTKNSLRRLVLLSLIFIFPMSGLAQRQMEKLGRGIIALKSSSTQVYVGWRLLGNDPEDIAFNLYRSANGAAAVKVNATPLTATTDYVDTPGNLSTTAYTYSVKPVLNGVEVADTWANPLSGPVTLPANAPTRQYIPIPMQPTPDDASAGVSYSVKFCWVGDLDGDGEYDFVVDRTNPSVEARQWLQAYKRDGTLLWQMNMGPNSVNHYNITPGSSSIGIGHGDNVTVYDMDGDGKAEVIVRTANGVVFGDGTTLNAPNDEVQYISIIDGMTGVEKARATVPVPSSWATQTHMNGHMGIVYADGMKPSVIWQSSNRNADNSFNDVVTAWDYRNGSLTQRWSWPFTGHTATAHQIRLADVDNDAKDEYVDIGLVLKADGSAQINQGTLNEVGHGDRFHIADIDPDRPGLETFLIQQNNGTGLATVYQAADKGAVLKKWYAGGVVDVGRGIVGDFDPNSKGCEFFSTQPGVFDAKGNQIYANNAFPPEAIWWGVPASTLNAELGSSVASKYLGRQYIATVGSTATSPAISWFDPNYPNNQSRIYTIYNETAPGVYQAYGGRPQFWGDILGDWREELLCVANDNSEMRIYTTKIPDIAKTGGSVPFRIYTLMHNPQYRIQTTTKGYVQSSYVDYYLGTDMTPPPPPPMVDAKLVWRGGAGATIWDAGVTQSWLNNGVNSTYANGDTVRFDISGNNTTTVALSGNLQPGAVTVYSPKSYTFDGTNGSIGGTTKLVKAGAGTLTISGNHSFSGKTTVWDGGLYVNGNLQQSPVTVWGGTWGGSLAAGVTGGRIGGTGVFSQPVTVKYRGAVTPGAGMGSAGTVTFGAGLSAEDGSTFALDLSDDPTGLIKANDRIAVTGNLALSGKVAVIIKPLNSQLATGTYTLLTYSGTLTGSLSNLTVTLPAGTPYTLAAASGAITLTVPVTRSAANVTWRGTGGAWDLAASQNWLRAGSPDVFVSGDTVAFDATGAATPTATLNTVVPVAGVTVNSATDYTITGTGSISGAGGLTKSGTGTLTMSTTNDFTGPTTINGGVLAVNNLNDGGASSSIGAATTAASNFVINGGTLRLTGLQTNTNRNLTIGTSGATFDVANVGSSLQISGVASGGGALTKTGPGTLILASANTYSGGTVINGGTIYLAGSIPNVSGLGNGTVTINNGTLTMSDVQANENAAWNLIVPTGATAQLRADGRCSLSGSLTGGGDLTYWTGYVRTDLSGNWSAFTGRIFAISDTAGGDFRVNNTNGFTNSELNFGDNVYAYSLKGGTLNVGALSGSSLATIMTNAGSSGGVTTTWQVGALNRDTTFAGTIKETVALTKVGTGTLTLTGTCTHTGATTVNAGTLLLYGSFTGSNVTVNSGGTLGGTGTIAGNVTVNNGGKIKFDVTAGVVAGLGITGNLAMNGTITVSPNIVSGNLAVGTYTIATYSGTLTGTRTFVWSRPAGSTQTATFDTSNTGVVKMTVIDSASNLTWTGATSNAWDTATANWASSGAPALYADASNVTFDDTATASATVITAPMAPKSLVFNNSTLNYTVSGSGSISGNTGLTKSGTGTLTLTTANTFTGATIINNGTLKIVGGGLAHRWSFNNSLADSIGGQTASIVDVGANNATLGATGVTLAGGTSTTSDYVSLGANILPNDTTPVTIEIWATQNAVQKWGRIFDFGASTTENLFMSWTSSTTLTADRVEWVDGVSSAVNNSNQPYTLGTEFHIAMVIEPGAGAGGTTRVTWYRAPSASGTLGAARGTFDSTNTLANFTDTNCWIGRSQWPADNTASATFNEVRVWNRALAADDLQTLQISGPDAIMNGSLPSSTAVTLTSNTAKFDNQSGQIQTLASLAGVAGSEVKLTTGGLSVGSDNSSTTFAGFFSGAGGFTKTGTGTITLSGASIHSGTTSVSGGTLALTGSITNNSSAEIANTATLNLNSGTLTMSTVHIASGGTLTGCGTINASLVNDGTIASGCGSPGKLVVNGNITNNGFMQFTAGTGLQNTGTFTNNGTLDLITGVQSLPANFVNNGTVFDSSSVKISQITSVGADIRIFINSVPGHSYQLQRRTSLTTGTWTNVGSPLPGNGSILTLAEVGGASGSQGFYRVLVSP
jgi:autotransporter-associated beta strand protein